MSGVFDTVNLSGMCYSHGPIIYTCAEAFSMELSTCVMSCEVPRAGLFMVCVCVSAVTTARCQSPHVTSPER